MDAPDRRQILLMAVLVLIAGYLGVNRIYLPKRAELIQLEGRLEALLTHNQTAQEIEATGAVRDAEGGLAEIQRGVSGFAASLPREEELPELIDALSQEAHRAEVALTQLHPSGQLTDGGVEVRQFDLTVLGSYPAITEFLTRVAALPWLVAASVADIAAQSETVVTEETGFSGHDRSNPPAARLQAQIGLEVALAASGEPRTAELRPPRPSLAADWRISMVDPFRSPLQADSWGLRPENLSLLGVIRSGSSGGSIAMLARADGARPLRLREGDQVGGLRVQTIGDDRVLVSFDDLGVVQAATIRLRTSPQEEPA